MNTFLARLDAIDAMSEHNRRILVERLSEELLRPEAMYKVIPKKVIDEAFTPVRNAPPPWVTRRTKHGTLSGYTAGCRCNPCRRANSKYKRDWTAKKVAKEAKLVEVAGEAVVQIKQSTCAPFVIAPPRPKPSPMGKLYGSVDHEEARRAAAAAL